MGLFRRGRRSEEDFDAEIESHLQLEADRLVETGLSRDEATAAARRAFGNVMNARERFYESNRRMWLDDLSRNARYALRQMRSAPGVTLAIVLSLALGIGVNTAIFSLADQALLRALPVSEPERLVQLDWQGRFVGLGMGSVGFGNLVPYPLYRELREENDVFEDVFARSSWEVHVAVAGESEPASVELVTGSYFPTLGVKPALGRLLTDADDLREDAHPVVVLSWEYWHSRFGAAPGVLGQQVRVNDYPMTVVGVAERGFRGMDWSVSPALWVPTMMKARVTPEWSGLFDRKQRFLQAYGRLKAGVSRAEAEQSLQPWFASYLRADTEREGWPQLSERQLGEYLSSRLDLLPGGQGQSAMRESVRQPMLILVAASILILVLACLNVANLSLARALARRRGTALRAALGASRRRIVGEQLIESALLALTGCVVGAAVAPAISAGMLAFLPQHGGAGVALSPALDLRVLGYAAAAAVLATLLSGTAPALFAASVRPVRAIREQASTVTESLGLRKALVVGQFALALVLLIGAGLFSGTLATLRAEGPGFPTDNLLMFRVKPISDGYTVADSKPLFRRLLVELEALPQARHVGLAAYGLLRMERWNNPVTVDSTERVVTEESLPMNAVTPGFFEALGVRVTRGRGFTARDSKRGSEWDLRSTIVTEEFVRRYVPDGNPIGARIAFGTRPDADPTIEIVGVVSDFHSHALRKPEAQIFFALWERSVTDGVFYARMRAGSGGAARSIRDAVARVDPGLAVLSLRTVDDQLDRMLANERMLATLAGAFATCATLLAMIGLYGVLSYSAARRTREMGIRRALGATGWTAGALVLEEAAALAALGLAIGLPASWALGRLVESQLFGVRPMETAVVAGAGALLTLVCLAAGALPARRAGTVSPLVALREE